MSRSTIPTHEPDAMIDAQVAGIALEPAQIAELARLSSAPMIPTTELRQRQLQRQLADRAAAHARREITTEIYLADHARITAELDMLHERPFEAPIANTATIRRRIREIRRSWSLADRKARAALVRAIYDRVTIEDGRVVEVALTPDAWRHGLALALPTMVVRARPARDGLTRATIAIEGRDELERQLRRSA